MITLVFHYNIVKYIDEKCESKNICFLREKIIDMNYGPGSHYCNPVGEIKYSSKIYINKHMAYLGIHFLTNKLVNRYERSHKMREKNWHVHYTNNVDEIKNRYESALKICKIIE